MKTHDQWHRTVSKRQQTNYWGGAWWICLHFCQHMRNDKLEWHILFYHCSKAYKAYMWQIKVVHKVAKETGTPFFLFMYFY